MKLRLLSILIILAAACSAHAAVYVDSNCPGSRHDGRTWGTAYRSIGDAMSKTRSGDIWVRAGLYTERVLMGKYRNLYGGFVGTETTLSQRPANGPVTIIDAQGLGRAVDVPVGGICILDGLVIRNGRADRGGGIRVNTNSTAKISRCVIENCSAAQMAGGVYFGTYTKGTVSSCIIQANTAPDGGGVVVEYHSYPVISRTIIAWNTASDSGGGLYCPFHSGARLENCTLAFNTAATSGGAVYAYQGGPVTLISSIIAWNASPAAGGVFGGGVTSATTISRCCFWANDGGDWGGAIRTPPASALNVFVDPLFVDAAHGDFRLQAGSTCRGMGACP